MPKLYYTDLYKARNLQRISRVYVETVPDFVCLMYRVKCFILSFGENVDTHQLYVLKTSELMKYVSAVLYQPSSRFKIFLGCHPQIS